MLYNRAHGLLGELYTPLYECDEINKMIYESLSHDNEMERYSNLNKLKNLNLLSANELVTHIEESTSILGILQCKIEDLQIEKEKIKLNVTEINMDKLNSLNLDNNNSIICVKSNNTTLKLLNLKHIKLV